MFLSSLSLKIFRCTASYNQQQYSWQFIWGAEVYFINIQDIPQYFAPVAYVFIVFSGYFEVNSLDNLLLKVVTPTKCVIFYSQSYSTQNVSKHLQRRMFYSSFYLFSDFCLRVILWTVRKGVTEQREASSNNVYLPYSGNNQIVLRLFKSCKTMKYSVIYSV